ncbi:hypothetical protein H634G_11233 [Metarhizium anisopliae BRIP 53293]|uniref:Uncharacterized protein n=1 Tax=Metarhizium anisopliae BRIP 53293 TaxID=1291518 RepID=A0A0D9NLP9_METAN|nr:hypothetical protein H634G_11233 [Metarhizium anisopliae BRIP 53293]
MNVDILLVIIMIAGQLLLWHLLYCRSLKSIRLHVSKRMDQRSLQWFLSNLSLQRVRHLHLQGADLTTMNIDVVDSLQTLDLKLCRGLDSFLARLVSMFLIGCGIQDTA